MPVLPELVIFLARSAMGLGLISFGLLMTVTPHTSGSAFIHWGLIVTSILCGLFVFGTLVFTYSAGGWVALFNSLFMLFLTMATVKSLGGLRENYGRRHDD